MNILLQIEDKPECINASFVFLSGLGEFRTGLLTVIFKLVWLNTVPLYFAVYIFYIPVMLNEHYCFLALLFPDTVNLGWIWRGLMHLIITGVFVWAVSLLTHKSHKSHCSKNNFTFSLA